MKKLLSLLLLLTGCGTFERTEGYYAQSSLMSYIKEYALDREEYLYSKKPNYNIEFRFDNLGINEKGHNVLGRCYTYKNQFNGNIKKEIRLDISFWNSAYDCQKKLVIYHELGHCDLDLDHYNDSKDIMNSNINLIKKQFCDNDKFFIEEMFSR